MEYNLYIFAFSSFLMLGFSVHMLFTTIGNTYLNKLLAAMMGMRGLQMLYYIAINTGQTFFVSIIINSLGSFLFMYGAFLYLYIRGFIRDESRLQKKDLLHLIPFLIALIDSIPYYFLDADTRANFISDVIAHRAFFVSDSFGIFPYYLISIFRYVLLVTYFILSWRLVIKSGIIKFRKTNPIVTNWILFFLLITTLSNLSMVVNFIINISAGASTSNLFLSNYRVFIQSTILLGFFGYLFYNPKILYGFVFVSKEFAATLKPMDLDSNESAYSDELIESQESKKPPRATRKQALTFSEEEIVRIKEKMISLIETEKPFLNPDFSVGDLAAKMGLPSHHCSYILNEYVGKNFREWVNEYRVEFFIAHYPSLIANQTIVAIASKSGFKNKNTFYSAFEKVTGQTPSQYFDS